ncbi:MAG: aromatic amino acid aminotransferase, partial [Verrucomicrobia bacterium]|nr:aromatic amino acid aminotransferase [Verrucomicrobiota bacterium]
MTTTFSTLTKLPADPIYGMQVIFKSDPRPNKINLSIGVCQDPEGKVVRFKAAVAAEERLHLQKLSK